MYKFILSCLIVALLVGCSNRGTTLISEQATHSPEAMEAVTTPTASASTGEASGLEPKGTDEAPSGVEPLEEADAESTNEVLVGTFIQSGNNALYNGSVEITKLGTDRYHLEVSRVSGYSYNNGSIEEDFSVRKGQFIFNASAPEGMKLKFTENSVTVDYDGEGYGGMNAEPKGTYYLKNTGLEDSPFLSRLYDAVGLAESYRNGFTDVLTFDSSEQDKQILLVRSSSSMNRSELASEYVVTYNSKSKKFYVIGELNPVEPLEMEVSLILSGVAKDDIYPILHKDYLDRFIYILMERNDFGDRSLLYGEENGEGLTEEEAFRIVTGAEGKIIREPGVTKDDPVAVTEVSHSDKKSVYINKYDDVTSSDGEKQFIGLKWLSVDRFTGKVTELKGP